MWELRTYRCQTTLADDTGYDVFKEHNHGYIIVMFVSKVL